MFVQWTTILQTSFLFQHNMRPCLIMTCYYLIEVQLQSLNIFYESYILKRRNEHLKQSGLYDWLEGKHSEERILSYLVDLDETLIPRGLHVCTCKFKKHIASYTSSQITYFMLLMRSVFEQEGFFVLSLNNEKQTDYHRS